LVLKPGQHVAATRQETQQQPPSFSFLFFLFYFHFMARNPVAVAFLAPLLLLPSICFE